MRVDRHQRLPLSFSQRRLWFLDQLEPGSPRYNVPVAVRLGGPLDMAAFLDTAKALVRRHETLRTRFQSRDGDPSQVIMARTPVSVCIVDLEGLAGARAEKESQRVAFEQGAVGFDLSSGALMRVCAVRLAEDDHEVLLTLHHIVSDGWSMGVLVREVSVLYAAQSAGRAASLPPLPAVSYTHLTLPTTPYV